MRSNLPAIELLESTHQFPGPYMFKAIGRFCPFGLVAAARPGGFATAPMRDMWLCPQSQISRSARLSERPYSVSEYSTLGGTVA